MTKEKAIAELPLYAEERMPKPSMTHRAKMFDKKRFVRKYGIVFGVAIFFTLYTILLSAWVNYKAEKRVRAEVEAEYAQQLQAHKDQMAQEQAAERFLSGDASREAFINQETDAVAAVISKLATDDQKRTEASCMLARVMNPAYPGTFQEVAEQAQQWPLYDGTDKTFSQHDREIADSIVRPYIESGIIPNGLTEDYIYGSWSPSDYVLRNTWEFGQNTRTWRYQG